MRRVVALDIVVALGVVAVVGRRVKRRSNKISPSARPLIKKICLPPAFFIYFHLFMQTFQFLQQVHVKKCPSSIQCWDLNPQPSGAESPPITTRPWLPYKVRKLFAQIAILEEYLLPAPMPELAPRSVRAPMPVLVQFVVYTHVHMKRACASVRVVCLVG